MKYPNITSEEQLWSIEVSQAQANRITDAYFQPRLQKGWAITLEQDHYKGEPHMYIHRRVTMPGCVIVGSGPLETVNARLDALAAAGCALRKYEVVP